jgi:hypothetical protein
LEEIVAAPVKKTENKTGGIRCADHATPSIRKSWHCFAKKRRSLGRGFKYICKIVTYDAVPPADVYTGMVKDGCFGSSRGLFCGSSQHLYGVIIGFQLHVC